MKVRTQVRLSIYERGIAEALAAEYGYTTADARELVVEYIQVIRKISGYDNCGQYAQLLDRARRMNQPPAQWLERIQSVEKGEMRDRGIDSEEHQYLQMK